MSDDSFGASVVDPEIEIRRGRAARALLDNPDFVQVFEERERDITAQWKSAGTTAEREACHVQLIALREFKQVLETRADSGRMAAKKLAKQQGASQQQ